MNHPGDTLTINEAIEFLQARLAAEATDGERKRLQEMLAELLASSAREAAARNRGMR
jgi:hypothetical protein